MVCQQVAAIPTKRVAPPETRFLERDEIQQLLADLPEPGRLALRDRALILFLYNTGARVQEAADLRVEHLDLGEHPTARLHGKGDKWRTCPLWQQTARTIQRAARVREPAATASRRPVFTASGQPLTRYGIYKIVRRHAASLDDREPADGSARTPSGIPPPCTCSKPASRSTSSAVARPRRPHHHQPLRRDQHQSQAGRPARTELPGLSGDPAPANLAHRRDAAELARLALTVMCPKSVRSATRQPP